VYVVTAQIIGGEQHVLSTGSGFTPVDVSSSVPTRCFIYRRQSL